MGIQKTDESTVDLGDDEFAKFFAEAAQDSPPEEKAEEEKAEEKAEEEKAEEKAEEEKAEEEKAEEEKAEEKAPNPEVADISERLKKLEEQKPAPVQESPPEEKPAERKPFEPTPFAYTDEDKAKIDAFTKDWPDVAEAFELRHKAVVHELQQSFMSTFSQVLAALEEKLAPVIQSQVSSDEERHFQAIRRAHEDYDEVVKEVPAWITKQPQYLRAHLQKVYDEGSTQEVIELFRDFKIQTGRVTPKQPEPTPAKPQLSHKDEVPADRVAALEATPAKRTSVSPRGVDKTSFDDGWEEATAGA